MPNDSRDADKTREQLIEELSRVRDRLVAKERECLKLADNVADLKHKALSDREHKNAEKSLRTSKEKYRTLFNSIKEGFCIVEAIFDENGKGIDHRFIEVNPAFERHTGLYEAVGKTALELVPDLESKWPERYGRIAATGKSEHFIDGSEAMGRWFEVDCFRVGNPEEKRVALLFADITERKRTEEALCESERRYRLLFENMSEGFALAEMIWDEQGHPVDWRYLEVNKAWTQAEVPADEIVGRTAREVDPGIKSHWIETYGRVVQTGKSVMYENFANNFGKWFETFAFKHSENRFGLLLRDITDRKKAEAALRDSESLYKAIAQYFPEGAVYVFDHDLRFLIADGQSLKALGFTREELEGKTIREATDEEICNLLEPRYHRVLAGESLHFETRIKGRFFSSNYVPILNDQGNVIAGMVVSHDITDRKMTEKKLIESEARFRTMADGLPLIIWVHDTAGKQQFVNKTFLEFFGVTHGEMKEDRWQILMHPDDADAYASEFFACVRDQRSFYAQTRVKNADDEWRWIESWAHPRFSTNGKYLGLVGASADITSRKQTEAALKNLTRTLERQVAERTAIAEARSRQLQALAVELIESEEKERQRIAQLLHDDLQQLMASAKMQVQAAMADLPPTPLLSNVEKLLENAIAKSRHLSHELSPAVLYHSGLEGALEWLSGQMREQFGLQINLKCASLQQFDDAPLKSFVFRAVQELLFNCVKHSGGKSACVNLEDAGGTLVVTVIDQGRGFDPATIASNGEDSGFGLLTLHERINHIGGRLEIDSAPGQGSRFTLRVPHGLSAIEETLPRVPPQNSAKTEPQKLWEASLATGIRVILADDHKVMRHGLIRLVESQPDIQVVGEAADGRQALELARQLNPDVIVMDVSMHKLDGIEATRRIKIEMPAIRVIGLSMHDDKHIVKAMHDAGADEFIRKTASAAELVGAIYGVRRDS